MKEEIIKVLVKVPGMSNSLIVVMENKLKSFQQMVKGYIEVVRPFEDVIMIVNEEGKLLNLPVCIHTMGQDFNGVVIFAGVDGEEFCSLTDDQIKTIQKYVLEEDRK